MLLGVFRLPPLAIIVNGLPLNAPKTPFNCQSLASALRDAAVAVVALPRQRVDEPQLEVVAAIEARRPQLRHSSLGVLNQSVRRAIVIASRSSLWPACTRP